MHSDIDECQISSHNCSNNAICINTEGSFNCSSCKPGYSGNGYNCSGGCLRSFIYLLRLANPSRVTVTAHTELLGPVTVPSLMRNRPPHRGLRPLPFKNSRGFFIVPKNLFVRGLWDGAYDLSSSSEKTRKSNRLQISSPCLFLWFTFWFEFFWL